MSAYGIGRQALGHVRNGLAVGGLSKVLGRPLARHRVECGDLGDLRAFHHQCQDIRGEETVAFTPFGTRYICQVPLSTLWAQIRPPRGIAPR